MTTSVFGFSTEPSAGGDFTPNIKYDARAGRVSRTERIDTGNGFVSELVDITNNFKAIADFENIEVGWIDFPAGAAPQFTLVPIGSRLPDRPSDRHKNGIRFMLKLSKDCGGSKPIREIAGTSKAFLRGVEAVYREYEAAKASNAGKLPVIVLEKTTAIKSGTGAQSSTNYVPTFRIAGWAPRGDLEFVPKAKAAASNGHAAPAAATPPWTGSTKIEPPGPPASDDGFG
jgi:hypothetical protein